MNNLQLEILLKNLKSPNKGLLFFATETTPKIRKEVIALKKKVKQYLKRRIDKLLEINLLESRKIVDELSDDVKERIHQEIDKVFKDKNDIKEEEINE